MRSFLIEEIDQWFDKVTAGEKILLSGTVYTARDAAHKRIAKAIDGDSPLPFSLEGTAIYYAGPTPAKEGIPIGSCGPTTSSRMDPYMPTFTKLGLKCTIGKGDRAPYVYEAMAGKAIYLCAIGGAGALCARSIKEATVVAYDDLGCESVKRLVIENMPLYVAIDAEGNSIFGGEKK